MDGGGLSDNGGRVLGGWLGGGWYEYGRIYGDGLVGWLDILPGLAHLVSGRFVYEVAALALAARRMRLIRMSSRGWMVVLAVGCWMLIACADTQSVLPARSGAGTMPSTRYPAQPRQLKHLTARKIRS